MNLQDQISGMSNSEKLLLVEELWNSIDKNSIALTSTQKRELDKRLDQHAKGESNYTEWNSIKGKLK